ncbi:BREX system ATP-binding domain-containing protein [Pedobacter sandarakinus]|uniref:BREX system ATP-binding domain-containing protein n=1 Tax=Pedobacter sandarakinus TaxID=353156 RepID=UPI0022480B6A|nr:BREX system ATP-binding domain-containing protein [Pedobacter sandarakinus]MCX2573337.1 DUF2791 family P-loop domain-containing protein [Pedobacter sandarakinus]
MVISNLWQNLAIKDETKANLIKDLSEGKVPQLPYFVVGLDDIKSQVQEKIEAIDGGRMVSNFIIARYGNGKTNLLKYLELFFENHTQVRVLYKRANIDQPDIGLFLLKEIQDHFTETLVNQVIALRSTYNFEVLTNGFPESFRSVEEYVNKLFAPTTSEEDIKRLIYLGTGRLYTKAEFGRFELEQLSNFERKEILVIFLNILALSNIFLIFQIDELEKIYEKSKLRLNAFFTSYREIFDLFSFVKGHYLMCSQTDANSDPDFIRQLNEAFYTRIEPHILMLPNISGKEQISVLVSNLKKLFGLNKSTSEEEAIVKNLVKQKIGQNRDLIREATHLLNAIDKPSWNYLLDQFNLRNLYENTKNELEFEGLLRSLSTKFFDPLETYLEGSSLLENGSEIKSRDYQSFIDNVGNKVHYFILNENTAIDVIQYKVEDIFEAFQRDIIIYAPVKLELKNGMVVVENCNIEIVDIEPQELFILLNMYRDNFEHQTGLSKVIAAYTNDNL